MSRVNIIMRTHKACIACKNLRDSFILSYGHDIDADYGDGIIDFYVRNWQEINAIYKKYYHADGRRYRTRMNVSMSGTSHRASLVSVTSAGRSSYVRR